jgi:ribosomal protein L40E
VSRTYTQHLLVLIWEMAITLQPLLSPIRATAFRPLGGSSPAVPMPCSGRRPEMLRRLWGLHHGSGHNRQVSRLVFEGFRRTPINAKDHCARCGAPVAPTAVHCRRCWGLYDDLRANRWRPKTPDAVMVVGAWRTEADGVMVREIRGD